MKYVTMKLLRVTKLPPTSKQKYVAEFKTDSGRIKKTKFGAQGYRDFTLISDSKSKYYIKDKKERLKVRDAYQRRHAKDLKTENNKLGIGAGSLAFFLLWNTPKMNVSAYRKRFNL